MFRRFFILVAIFVFASCDSANEDEEVLIRGAINKPGPYSVSAFPKLSSLLAEVEVSRLVEFEAILVKRNNNKCYSVNFKKLKKKEEDFWLKGGDEIIVFERGDFLPNFSKKCIKVK